VADIADVGMDDSLLDLQHEGLGIVERRVDVRPGAPHLPANPRDVDAKVGSFVQQQVVRIDKGGGECIRVWGTDSGGGARRSVRRGGRGNRWISLRVPEEPAKAEDRNYGSGGEKSEARSGHCAILGLDRGASAMELKRVPTAPFVQSGF
jgi:hypothetical protein